MELDLNELPKPCANSDHAGNPKKDAGLNGKTMNLFTQKSTQGWWACYKPDDPEVQVGKFNEHCVGFQCNPVLKWYAKPFKKRERSTTSFQVRTTSFWYVCTSSVLSNVQRKFQRDSTFRLFRFFVKIWFNQTSW